MKLKILLITFLLINVLNEDLFSQTQNQTYNINGFDIEVVGDLNGFSLDWKTNRIEDGLEIATITLNHAQGATPPKLSLKWAVPSNNIAGYWSSSAYLDKTITPDWGPAKVKSMLSRHAPVISLFGYDDVNRQTFAVSEALSTVVTSTSVKEENGMMYNEIQLFTEAHKKLKTYQIEFRLDTRSIPFSKSLTEVASWWAAYDLYAPSTVPEAAKLPVYSSWYSYHQNVTKDALVKECKLAKSMGFESIIVDDGWQTLDSSRGYAYTGDWNPERIPEMKAFVSAVHDLDMKFILWYAVPFVGEKSQAYKQMKGKFLDYWESQGTYIVDPRFPEVREFIINTYIKAVNEWGLDGFKLDFLGRFKAGKDTKLIADEGRDYASINDATDRLMTDLMTSLREVKPDIMIEFRQPYTGPAMRKYGNMLRASDCPNVALINRVGTTDLRLLSGNTAVHADMLMWHYRESVEVAAFQLLNVMFSVPQISVRLADIPQEQFNMIRFYTDYWLKNRNVFLDGEFLPSNPQSNYPKISGRFGNKEITVLYGTSSFLIDDEALEKLDVINAKMSNEVVLISKQIDAVYKYKIKDCQGSLISNGETKIKTGANLFEVPISGLISFEKINN
ncbi:glycosidase [Gaetbulibacter sp. 4G1]|nr:glycoside hydrolase family 36 protein [Gaetbulibacter sp. 4G1]PIA81062.1 glycosidase [Gaetbulibacter sp. 4G1]